MGLPMVLLKWEDRTTEKMYMLSVVGKKFFLNGLLVTDRNPDFEHNRIFLRGMEEGHNNNLTEGGTSIECTQGGLPYRNVRLHPVSYALGNTTDGCKGFPLDKWCKWASESERGVYL